MIRNIMKLFGFVLLLMSISGVFLFFFQVFRYSKRPKIEVQYVQNPIFEVE